MEETLSLRIFLRSWPVILVVVLVGVILGWVASVYRDPLYKSETVIAVNIHYGITESLELLVEDRALSRVVSFIQSDNVLQAVIDRLPDTIRAPREWSSPSDLRDSIQIDQRLAEWGLVVFDSDPQVAANVSQTWADVSLEILDEAKTHAWRAAGMLDGLLDVTCESAANTDANYPRQIWQCQVSSLKVAPEDLEGSLQTELELSHGVLPNITYELIREANLPEIPILWKRGLLIASGGLAGLILGSLAILLYPRKSVGLDEVS